MKRITAFALACVMALALCACGGKSEAKTIDLDALAEELLEAGIFTDSMSRPADGVAGRIYGFGDGDVAKAVLYTGTGATAEEIFLAEAASADGAKSLRAACEVRIENQTRAFESYVPAELVKLDDAVLVVSGRYVLFVVSGDAGAAKAVVDGYIGS